MRRSRLSPDTWHQRNKHEFIVSWLNEVIFDIKTMLNDGHVPLIRPDRLAAWQRHREELTKCGALGIMGQPNRHSASIEYVDEAIGHLQAIWDKEGDSASHTAALMRLLPSLDRALDNFDCRESRIKY
jgi:hypothetical protein